MSKWDKYKEIQNECFELGKRKNADYGNDAIGITGINGLAVRLLDKALRIHNLVTKGEKPEVIEEALEDSLKDMVNYATYGIIILRNPNIWYKD